MKRQFFAIPLFIISLLFVFSPQKSFATVGEDCCDSATLYSYDPTTGECKNAYSGVPNTPISCDSATEFCSGGVCVLGATTPCDSHQSCYDSTYRNTHIGCAYDGRINWCTYLGYPGSETPTVTPNSVFCDPAVGQSSGINTALGCIKFSDTSPGNDIITVILRIISGLGGGIALALILYGVFVVTTSAGMPDKLKAGSEIITSAIIGLIFILLSVFLVNLIGINILGIPGLS